MDHGVRPGPGRFHGLSPPLYPANLQASIDNLYFPPIPGTVFQSAETTDESTFDDIVTVTAEMKVAVGVTCIVVHDAVQDAESVKEDTYDWYAQDRDADVWYFGEATKEYYANDKCSTEGSWEAGVNGAQPGVVAVADSITAPYGMSANCVRTKDWSRLEAGSEKK